MAALDGIGAIATPEATAVLVDLTSGANAALATEAVRRLNARLPDPDFDGDGPTRSGPFPDATMELRRTLAAAAWRPEYAASVRATARAWLARDATQVALAAFMLECVGSQDDLPFVTLALDREIRASTGRVWKDNDFPASPGNADALERAARQLVKRGGTVPARPRTPGETALLAIAVQRDATFRPEGWQSAYATMLASDIPYLRQVAMARMPRPVPARFWDAIASNAESADLGVQHAALELIWNEKYMRLLPLAEQVTRTSRRFWVLNASDNALFAMASANRYNIWVDRLTQPGMAGEAMQRLGALIDGVSGSSWDDNIAADLAPVQQLWREFLGAHATQIQAGGKFRAGVEGGITAAMIPPMMSLWIDGKSWPERR
jgi:hypothetical protein